jgi:Arc/MetJ-type ribon-helix-helix transcriptional regulator
MSATVDRPVVPHDAPAAESKDKAPKPVRINVTMPEAHYEELRELATETGTDMSEFVRRAIRIYSFLQEERRKGKSVYVGEGNQVEKEIVLL